MLLVCTVSAFLRSSNPCGPNHCVATLQFLQSFHVLFQVWGSMQYSNCGLTCDLYNLSSVSLLLGTIVLLVIPKVELAFISCFSTLPWWFCSHVTFFFTSFQCHTLFPFANPLTIWTFLLRSSHSISASAFTTAIHISVSSAHLEIVHKIYFTNTATLCG